MEGLIMPDNKLVETLELMCDKDNPQDRKLLLLAELVETKCNALGETQEKLKKSLDQTNDKLDKLTTLLERYEKDTHGCPVYRNKEQYEKISFYVKNPKVSILVILGTLALLGGFFGANIVERLNKLFGL